MKLRSLLICVLVAAFGFGTLSAQDAQTEFKAVAEKINSKLKQGQRTAGDLAAELAEMDQILTKYKDQKTEDVARIALMRATLYYGVLGDKTKGLELAEQLEKDFPGTKAASMVEMIRQDAKAAETKGALVGKAAPELNFTWASEGDYKTLSALKGKVVILDFWATWCGPCLSSFPQIRELVEHYKGSPVVVLGVTSIQGRVVNLEEKPIDTKGDPDREMALMKDFIKAKTITWPVVFSKEKVFNSDYGVTGIPHMTIIAPDGTVRHNGLHPAMPHAEKAKMVDAILAEFKLPVPASH